MTDIDLYHNQLISLPIEIGNLSNLTELMLSQNNLTNLSEILLKYDDTLVLIEGHTDSSGSDDYNLSLSRSRAQSVANKLSGLSVDATRFTIMGYGEGQPVDDNGTSAGRQANRRVELAIMANDKLKKVAEDQAN